MIWEILSNPRFLLPLVIGLALVVAILFFTGAREDKRQATLGDNGRTVTSAAFQQPISTSMTVAGMVLPLAAALITYVLVELNVEISSVSLLFVSVLFLALGILAGIFNSFSIATAGDQAGNIKITKDRFTYLPAQVVSQFWLILLGIVYLALYCFLDLQVTESESGESVSGYFLPILRPGLKIGEDENAMRSSWGAPSAQRLTGSGIEYSYFGAGFNIRVTVQQGTITKILQEKAE